MQEKLKLGSTENINKIAKLVPLLLRGEPTKELMNADKKQIITFIIAQAAALKGIF